jgi:ParB family chromosome partitioning protein
MPDLDARAGEAMARSGPAVCATPAVEWITEWVRHEEDVPVSVRRGGLGKGLGALIPTGPASSPLLAAVEAPVPALQDVDSGPAEVPGATFRELPVSMIRPNPRQPRQVFDDEPHEELMSSIKEFGLLQPIVVRPGGDGDYELVVGERRWRAAADAGLETIPAIIRETADDAMLRNALLENLHRVQLNPLEEAAAYRQLLDEFGTTHEELAQRIGRSRSQVTNTIRLLNLPVPVQRRVAAGVLSAGHARALLTLDDSAAQDELAGRIVAEGMSVRAVEELVALAGQERPATPRASRGPRATAPALTDLADRLSDTFDTRVKVELGRRKGKIVVEFASVDDLERIVALMAPSVGPRSGMPSGE